MRWRFLFRSKQRKRKFQPDAFETALSLRTLILGSSTTPKAILSSLNQLKVGLLDPVSSKQIIAHLHGLSISESKSSPNPNSKAPVSATTPIHAVCLDCSDKEANEKWFSKLPLSAVFNELKVETAVVPSVAQADVKSLDAFLQQINIVNLVDAPDFGLGQPADGKGLLSGSIPTARTISDGLSKATEQLMALGFASTAAIWPNHTGVHPPTDRMSVITYWWGLELLLPPPSMKYLSHVTSISHALLNFLSFVAIVNNGVREVLPFVRYISQYVDFEWNVIKAQDKGKGVVCAATWIMPAALVPRPWDFPEN